MEPGGLVTVDVIVQGPSDGAPCSAVGGVLRSWSSCVDEGHSCSPESLAHDVGGRRSVTLTGVSRGFDPPCLDTHFP